MTSRTLARWCTLLCGVCLSTVAAPAVARAQGTLQPILNCVTFEHPGKIRAHFGYVSTYDTGVTVPVGPGNFFSPGVLNRQQPTVFHPGVHDRVFETTFTVSAQQTQVTWFLEGATTVAKIDHALYCGQPTWRGEWDPLATYHDGELVSYTDGYWTTSLSSYNTICDGHPPGFRPSVDIGCFRRWIPHPPEITSTSGDIVTIDEDTKLPPTGFAVNDVDNVWDLTFYAVSSDPELIPSDAVTFGGWGTNRTFSVTPAPNRFGSATITLYVTDRATPPTPLPITVKVLAVDDPPSIATVPFWTTDKNVPTPALPFTVTDIDTNTGSLVVTGQASNPGAAIVFDGTGTNRTVRVTPPPNFVGTTTITLTVSDGDLAAQTSFALTVRDVDTNPPPPPPPQPPPPPPPPPATRTYYLAEGATGPFFDLDVLLANPSTEPTPVTIQFLIDEGTTITQERTLPPTSRTTIRVDEIAGLEAAAVSTLVTSTTSRPIVVERTMRWDPSGYGAHTEKAASGAATSWYFAEGAQGFFSTFFLLVNPQTTANAAHVTYFREGEASLVRDYALLPSSRRTIDASQEPELIGRSFGARVDFDRPGAAERAMYFGTTPLFDGGHESAGVTAPATSWFLAEGATGSYFTTYILLANPQDADATVTLTYLPAMGAAVTKTYTIGARQRLTRNIALEDPSLASAAVATRVESTLPIVAERTQYWPNPNWFEAHNSAGVTETGTRWGLAEGRVGGPQSHQTYILLANPGSETATVTLTFLRADSTTLSKTVAVAPASRANVVVNGPGSDVPELADESFGTIIESTQPIAVERSMYSNANGITWAAGTNATATRLPSP